MSVFLSMAHAIFEDGLIFTSVGASVAWVVGFRLAWAALVTAAAAVVFELVAR